MTQDIHIENLEKGIIEIIDSEIKISILIQEDNIDIEVTNKDNDIILEDDFIRKDGI